MAQRINKLPGESDLALIFRVMDDPKIFKGYLKQLDDARLKLEAAQEKSTTLKKAKDALSNATKAEQDSTKAAAALKQKTAKECEAEQGKVADARIRVLDREKVADKREAELARAVADASKAMESTGAQLAARAEGLDAREEALAKLTAQANTLRDEYLAKVNKMRAALGDEPLPDDSAEAPKIPVQ